MTDDDDRRKDDEDRESRRSSRRRSRSRSRERFRRRRSGSRSRKKKKSRRDDPERAKGKERRRKRREKRGSKFSDEPPEGMILHGKTLVAVAADGTPSLPAPTSSYVDPTTKILRELYFGNVQGGDPMTDQNLKAFIEECFTVGKLLIMSGCPVQKVRSSQKFAFVEFRSIQETNNAMNLHGSYFNGKVISVARTKTYTGPYTKSVTWSEFTKRRIQEDPSLEGKFPGIPPPGVDLSTTVQDHSNAPGSTRRFRELYLGGHPENITSDQLKQFIEQAMLQTGLVKTQNCVKAVRMCGKFSFVEFEDLDSCAMALNLSGIPLLESVLRFSRPKSYDGVITQHGDWNEVCTLGIDGLKKKYPGMLPSTANQFPIHAPLPIPIMGGGVVPAASKMPSTRILQLSNMCTEEELKDDAEYADILEDVKDEMSKSGEVLSVKIPRPQDESVNKETIGLIYVEFKRTDDAVKALGTVQGRTFNGKPVGTYYYPEADFAEGKLVDISKAAAPTIAPPPQISQDQYQPGYQPPTNRMMMSRPPPGPPPPMMGGGFHQPPPQQFRRAPPPGPPPAPMGGFRGRPMGGVGRGRDSTVPAWMKKQQQ